MRVRPVTYRELIRVCRAGGVLEGRTVEASVIRRCAVEGSSVDPRGLHLRRVVVRGQLDLAGATVAFPLRFEGCRFEAAPVLTDAQLPALAITDSPGLPGLLANGVRVGGDLDLS